MYKNPNIIVVGSGRSGTSTVAGVCQNELGICMGHYMKPPNFMNPNGFYEDLLSHAIISTTASMRNAAYTAEFYLKVMNDQHKNCLAWGVKDPWFLYLPVGILKKLRPKLYVITIRPLDATVESWLKIWERNNQGQPITQKVVDHYANLTMDRAQLADRLANLWTNNVTIDFSQRVSEDSIVKELRTGLAAQN